MLAIISSYQLNQSKLPLDVRYISFNFKLMLAMFTASCFSLTSKPTGLIINSNQQCATSYCFMLTAVSIQLRVHKESSLPLLQSTPTVDKCQLAVLASVPNQLKWCWLFLAASYISVIFKLTNVHLRQLQLAIGIQLHQLHVQTHLVRVYLWRQFISEMFGDLVLGVDKSKLQFCFVKVLRPRWKRVLSPHSSIEP